MTCTDHCGKPESFEYLKKCTHKLLWALRSAPMEIVGSFPKLSGSTVARPTPATDTLKM